MEKIPMEWVEKLWNCMELFYGDRWVRLYEKAHVKSYAQSIWQSGLTGLTYDEIKGGLLRCKGHAKHNGNLPPHVMEFYHWSKIDTGRNKDTAIEKANPSLAKEYLDEIKKKTNYIGKLDIQKRLFL